ncbi:transcription antitermination factor NusB [Salinicoccus halitifaciens]|uniref:Transcription antitermination protein NusB n=1 Tax=Salinicoccus halitifaciens TaxID=1073415 RepID=A0ABV2E8E9_9STAP|nr:transcription antitermination factor NusB [Salinicoccus halitifaciens]MCD2136912.1 transcription antitermination factor NusB [Salinicoccus halitifaciens]
MNRHEQRKKIFQILFQIDHDLVALEEAAFHNLFQEQEYMNGVISHYISNKETVDGHISRHLSNYTLERISKAERNVLRMAVAELLLQDSPPKVIINEAVRIAKLYGDKDSHKFVNGVLKNFPEFFTETDDDRDGN